MLTHRRSCLWQSSDSYQTAISDGHFEAGCSTPHKHGCSPETRSNSCTDVSSHSWFKGCCRVQAVCTQNTPRPIAERVLLGHGRAARPSSTHLRAAQSGRIKEVEVRRLHLSLPNKSTVDMKGGRLHLQIWFHREKRKASPAARHTAITTSSGGARILLKQFRPHFSFTQSAIQACK